MKRILAATLLTLPIFAAAQSSPADRLNKMRRHLAAKTAVASSLEDLYDIHHLKFDISMTNTSTAVSGALSPFGADHVRARRDRWST